MEKFTLVVYGIHSYADDRHRPLREAWEASLQEAVSSIIPNEPPDASVKIKHHFVALSLSSIPDLNRSVYKKEMGRFQKCLEHQDKHDSPIRSSPDHLFPQQFLEMLQKYRKRRQKTLTRYMFVVQGLATWMVKDLMFRERDLYKDTVAIVYVDTDTLINMGNAAGDAQESYQDTSVAPFGENRVGPRVPTIGWSQLSETLKDIDRTFDKLDCICCLESTSWKMGVKYNTTDGKLVLENLDILTKDFSILTIGASRLVREEDQSHGSIEHQDILETRKDRLMRDMTEMGLSENTESFMTPHFEDIGGLTKSITITYPLDTNHESLLFKDYQDQAEAYFRLGDLRTADRLLSACLKLLGSIKQPQDNAELKVGLLHGVVLLQLGHHSRASERLLETSETAKKLLFDVNDEAYRNEISLIGFKALLQYATALMCTGKYRQAQEILEDIIQGTRKWKTRGTKSSWEYMQVAIGARQALALNQNYLGTFYQIEYDEHLKRAKSMLKDLSATINFDASDESIDGVQVLRHEIQVTVTESKILILQGDYRRARGKLDTIYARLETNAGPNNILTLEAAILLAETLVRTSGIMRGEKIAVKAKRRIEEHLDQEHPLAMEATYILIMAYIAQGREMEALGTAQHLCHSAGLNKSINRTNQLLRYYAQLSEAHVYLGNYQDAEMKLREQLQLSEFIGKSRATASARYDTRLAWALVHQGKFQEAERHIHKALRIQLDIYAKGKVSIPDTTLTACDTVYSTKLLEVLPTVKVNVSRSLVHHPDILFTLHVISELESRKSKPALERILEIRKTILRSLIQSGDEDNDAGLLARLSLGYAHIAMGHAQHHSKKKSFKQALENFRVVSKICEAKTHLSKEHPIALQAQREAALSHLYAGAVSDSDVQRTHSIFAEITTLQQRKLGSNHPQTLRTILCHLSIAIFLNDPMADSIRKKLVSHLQDPKIRKQRCIEALLMEERIVHIYMSVNDIEACRPILKELADPGGYGVQETVGKEVWNTCEEISNRARESLKRIETYRLPVSENTPGSQDEGSHAYNQSGEQSGAGIATS